jgi:hypothetical protein
MTSKQELLEEVLSKISADVFLVEKFSEYGNESKQTVRVADFETIKGFIISNDENLPDYQEKERILTELFENSGWEEFNVNEKTFLIYFMFFLFLFPETPIVESIMFCLKVEFRTELRYLQIFFETCVEKMHLKDNAEIQIILSSEAFQKNHGNIEEESMKGGGNSLHLIVLIVISILFSVSYSAIYFPTRIPTIVQNSIKKTDLFTKHLKDFQKLFTEPLFFKKLTTNVKKHLKILQSQQISRNETVSIISNTLDTVHILKVFETNEVFSFIMDSKKVGKSLLEIFITKNYENSFENNIILLGAISKLFLYASTSLNANFALILDSTNALGSFTTALGSLRLLYELHKDVVKTYEKMSSEEKESLLRNYYGGGKVTRYQKKHQKNTRKTQKKTMRKSTKRKTTMRKKQLKK